MMGVLVWFRRRRRQVDMDMSMVMGRRGVGWIRGGGGDGAKGDGEWATPVDEWPLGNDGR